MIRRFLGEDVGATSIEYGLIAALVAVVTIAGLGNVGVAVRDTFRTVGSVVESPQSAAATRTSSSSETASTSSTREGATRTGSGSSTTSEAATTSGATRAPTR